MKRLQSRPWLRGCLILFLIICGLASAAGFYFRNTIIPIAAVLTEVMKDPAYTSGLDTPEAILDYLAAEPDTAALVSYTVDPQGNPLEDGTAIFHNADRPMTLASTMKIVVLAAYAEAEAAGTLDPQETIPVSAWEQYYLPGTDGNAHPAALQNLSITTNEQGFAASPEATVTLDDIVWAMIRYSDNAATDYLLNRVGETATTQLTETAGLSSQEPIFPLLGLILSWQNHEHPVLTSTRTETLQALSLAELREEAHRWADKFLTDEAWRTAELDWRANGRQPNLITREIALANSTAPTATAADYAHMMARIATDQFVSAEVSQIMRRYLEWPIIEFESNLEEFSAIGTKGGSLAAVMTEATYFVPTNGDFANQTRITVLFQNNMPFSAWLTQSQTFAQQSFMRKLAKEKTFATEVQSKLNSN